MVFDIGAAITTATRPEAPELADATPVTARSARWLADLPDRVILLFLCVAFAVGPLVTIGQFRPVVVLVVALILLVLAARVLPTPAGRDRRHVVGAGIAVGIAILWVLANLPLASEYFIVVRDPAVYTLRGLWLTHHSSPNLPISEALQGAHGVPGALVETDGFYQQGTQWQPQGPTMLPALLAVGGWVAGRTGVLTANLVIGGIALMVVYAVGRRLLGPYWALAPMIGLALSIPMMAFSRAPYTEPTALVLGLGGIVLIWSGLSTGRRIQIALGGLSLGATFLTRADGLLFVLGATLALGIASGLARDDARRRRLRWDLLAFLAGAAISLTLGYFDLAKNSAPYEARSWTQIKPLSEVTAVAVVVALLFTVAPGLPVARRWLADRRRLLAIVTVCGIALAFGYLALRPLFYVAHSAPDSPGVTDIGLRQEAENLPVDGTRTYDEFTVHWLAWYFSWPVVILGALGVAVLVARIWTRRDPRPAVLLGIFGVGSALYLNRSLITPDQVWAMRRFLPIVVPVGLMLAAMVPMLIVARWPRWRAAALVLGLLIAFAPITTWRSVLTTRQYGGAEAFTNQLCTQVGQAHLIIADRGDGGTIFLPTLRIRCGIQAVLLSDVSKQSLLAVRKNWSDGRPIVVLAFLPEVVPWRAAPTRPTLSGTIQLWEEPLTSRPARAQQRVIPTYFGDLDGDGTVTARA